ncbi:MAG: HlyD family efflux transporter periplasmic adaptor subunit [Gammaproteobacteria bacterium]|nr:HlyD family efflux transporter periplasmic adaptor subunit [Gammaproteobacteria bacterium]
MDASRRRLLLWTALGLLVLIGLGVAFRPASVPVDVLELSPGPLVVTLGDEGETRVRDVFVLSAPVAGRLRRITLDAGDPVTAGDTVIAEIEPVDPDFLDPRSEAQARAAIRAAESAEQAARAQVEEAAAELEFAENEVVRIRDLFTDGTVSVRELDQAERANKSGRAALAAANAELQVRRFELERARAQLLSPAAGRAGSEDCECVSLTAPVDGQVLRVIRESEGVVAAAEPLVEIGDPGDLEIVADLLSTDAVRAAPGQRVFIEDWGGPLPLEGVVRRIEPFGFTKVSALGIEEQRVNVIIDITSPEDTWVRLGHGYQVEVRVVLWEQDDVITVPLTALFRNGVQWAVFIDDGGVAMMRDVEIGERNGIEAQIISGLSAGDTVVLHPSDRVADGVRITPRG